MTILEILQSIKPLSSMSIHIMSVDSQRVRYNDDCITQLNTEVKPKKNDLIFVWDCTFVFDGNHWNRRN